MLLPVVIDVRQSAVHGDAVKFSVRVSHSLAPVALKE